MMADWKFAKTKNKTEELLCHAHATKNWLAQINKIISANLREW